MEERCRQILERAYVLIDGEGGVLSEAERVEIQTHIEECGPCLERYGLERQFLIAITDRLEGCNCACPGKLKGRISDLLDTI